MLWKVDLNRTDCS